MWFDQFCEKGSKGPLKRKMNRTVLTLEGRKGQRGGPGPGTGGDVVLFLSFYLGARRARKPHVLVQRQLDATQGKIVPERNCLSESEGCPQKAHQTIGNDANGPSYSGKKRERTKIKKKT